VAGQVLAHRGTGVVGQWFTDEAVNPFGDTDFVGHEIVEGHVDRAPRCNGAAIADQPGEHQFEPVDARGGDLLYRHRRAVHARCVDIPGP